MIQSIRAALLAITVPASFGFFVSMSLADSAQPPAATPEAPPASVAPTPVEQTSTTPLMHLLDDVGLGSPMEKAGIDVYGAFELGYTYNLDNPHPPTNAYRTFDLRDQRLQVDQLSLNIERTVDPSVKKFDVGFKLEALYGFDAGTNYNNFPLQGTRSNGLFWQEGTTYNVFGNSEYQLDLPDAYIDIAIPVGNGIRLRAGRFEFFKPIDPSSRIFYSTTFSYFGAFFRSHPLPFTNTGITAAYDFSDKLSAEAGFSRGGDQSLDDNNGAIDFIGKINYTTEDRTKITASTSVGPELPHDCRDYSALIDVAVSHPLSDDLTLLVDGFYYHQFGSGTKSTFGPTNFGFLVNLPDNVYGVSGNLVYKCNKYLSAAVRGEWYRDERGLTTGRAQSLYEVTLGVTVTPFPDDKTLSNLSLRPEIREDWSSANVFVGHSGHRYDQTTVGCDAIFRY